MTTQFIMEYSFPGLSELTLALVDYNNLYDDWWNPVYMGNFPIGEHVIMCLDSIETEPKLPV